MDRIAVVGIPVTGATGLDEPERRLIAEAAVVAGGRRHLAQLVEAGLIGRSSPDAPPSSAIAGHRMIELDADLPRALDALASARALGRVVVAATGDPGFFGIGRLLAERFGTEELDVRPAASSVAVAFARLGLPWDDAVVASAHGRQLEAAVAAVRGAPKAAVLASPENPPEAICAALAAGGGGPRGAVVSDLGGLNEQVVEGDLAQLAARAFPALSVVLTFRGRGVAPTASVAFPLPASARVAAGGRASRFGLAEQEFEHRNAMITKPEVRAVCLARLELPPTGVLWDVGAGSGSIGIEAAGLQPGLDVYAVERRVEDVARIERNAARHGARVRVVAAEAPEVLEALPDPDRVVVGGGGATVLEAVLGRLRTGGRVVATFSALGRAAAAGERLGNLAEISVSRGRRLPDGAFRLVAADPVFVCWGPE
jgi:precorrin-6Y C5,15-methyltransferase (decarboxylating)